MAGFDYRQYMKELPDRPKTAPIYRKKQKVKKMESILSSESARRGFCLGAPTNRYPFGKTVETLFSTGRRFTSSQKCFEPSKKNSFDARVYGESRRFVTSFQQNGFDEGIGCIGRLGPKDMDTAVAFKNQILQVLAYDLTNEKNREKFILKKISLAGQSKKERLQKKKAYSPSDILREVDDTAIQSDGFKILNDHRLKKWTGATERQFQKFQRDLTGRLAFRSKMQWFFFCSTIDILK